MNNSAPTAFIADDEDLPRAELRRMLATAWPELRVVAECEDGPSAVEALDIHAPQIAFLDIRMPGMSGLEVARAASGRCHTVFTTAYDSHAVAAFVVLAASCQLSASQVQTQLRSHVAQKIGPIAKPSAVVVVPDVPKTRSGKIMRRLLTQMYEGTPLGDTTSLQNNDSLAGIAAAIAHYQNAQHREKERS